VENLMRDTHYPPEVLSGNDPTKTDVKDVAKKQQGKHEGKEQEETGADGSEKDYFETREH
jgi:hypothetical protein